MTEPLQYPESRPGGWAAAGPVAPFLRAPEASKSIFLVMFVAACLPLGGGTFFFGWRCLVIAALSVGGCIATEALYYRMTRVSSLMGRSHAALTGLLLALTLPPYAPWYVPLAGAVFAIVVGKALFGGVGHFVWQPALVGRLAVGVIFAPPLMGASLLDWQDWPVLAESRVILGDVTSAAAPPLYQQWHGTPPPKGADALLLPKPVSTLRQLTTDEAPPPDRITSVLRRCPPIGDMIMGAYGGGIGETCIVAILVAGLYLVYRNYVPAHLPGLFLLAAAVTVAVAPIRAPDGSPRWLPILTEEGFDVGLTYVCYQLACGQTMLAAWFLATEMTSRPVTAPAQAIFAILAGVLAMLIRLYLPIAIPAYAAVLIANTFVPLLDNLRRKPLGFSRKWRKGHKFLEWRNENSSA